jgi:hypothetical protein
MTSGAHLAGTADDYKSALYIYNKWSEQKLDYVKIIDYDVLLSYPDANQPNKLFINKIIFIILILLYNFIFFKYSIFK